MSDSHSLHHLRKDYRKGALLESQIPEDPIPLFREWMDDAMTGDIYEPNAMTLSTVDARGYPSSRIVLLKGFGKEGFYFFTNYNSRKGKELEKQPRASLLFYWDRLERQVRMEGFVQRASAEVSDAYFDSRPLESRMGALASPQSERVANREALEKVFDHVKNTYSENVPPKRPEHWGGFVFLPERFEFWQGRSSRMHDRIVYERTSHQWTIHRLAP